MKLPKKLFDFAFVPFDSYEGLADLAMESEYWGDDCCILKSYLENLYKRIAQVYNANADSSSVDVISISDNHACFDTGLYTDHYERVFALFELNRIPDKQKWHIKGFYRENDLALDSIDDLPQRVIFYDDPADLVFDSRLEIKVNFEHILGDEENVSRFPDGLQGDDKRNDRYRILRGAVDEAKKRVAANYMLAVPQFFTDRNSETGKMQLLLPLCLEGDKPGLALAIERDDDCYKARTCLSLDMAYNNARLINKPEAQWLVQGV